MLLVNCTSNIVSFIFGSFPLHLSYCTVKLSTNAQQIAQAYDEFIDAPLHSLPKEYSHHARPWRYPHHVIPRNAPYPTPPRPAVTYHNDSTPATSSVSHRELVLHLALIQATYQDSPHPITPDQVPIIIDSGASVLITPHLCDSISPPTPVQPAVIKDIASGLQINGIGSISFTFTNDNGQIQTLLLHNYLYVPQYPVCLLCPCQIGTETGFPGDGFNSLHPRPILIVYGLPITLHYDPISKLPVLYTNPGITSYTKYLAGLSSTKAASSSAPDKIPHPYENLSKLQRQKLFLHEKSNHEGFHQLEQVDQSWAFSPCTFVPCC